MGFPFYRRCPLTNPYHQRVAFCASWSTSSSTMVLMPAFTPWSSWSSWQPWHPNTSHQKVPPETLLSNKKPFCSLYEKVEDKLKLLVGGFNPSEKYARQNGNLSQIGVKIKNNKKNIWNHQPGSHVQQRGLPWIAPPHDSNPAEQSVNVIDYNWHFKWKHGANRVRKFVDWNLILTFSDGRQKGEGAALEWGEALVAISYI